MLRSKKKVIFITSGFLEGAEVEVSGRAKVKKRIKIDWKWSSLMNALAQMVDALEMKSAYLVLGEQFSYDLKFLIPQSMQGLEERRYVFEIVKNKIPEELVDEEWDFRETGVGDDDLKEVFVFVPVKAKFQLIKMYLRDAGCRILAVEPEVIARSRNSDPVIGMALKKDFSGKDQETLNILSLKSEAEVGGENEEYANQPKKKSRVRASNIFIFLIFIMFVVIVLGIRLFSYFEGELNRLQNPVSYGNTGNELCA